MDKMKGKNSYICEAKNKYVRYAACQVGGVDCGSGSDPTTYLQEEKEEKKKNKKVLEKQRKRKMEVGPLHSVLSTLHSALCTLHSALCTLHKLCPLTGGEGGGGGGGGPLASNR